MLLRAERRTAQGVTVDLAALSAAEVNGLVGFDITKAGIQPVWVRVRNREAVRYYIPPSPSTTTTSPPTRWPGKVTAGSTPPATSASTSGYGAWICRRRWNQGAW
jgi:hypothetical protein